MRGQLKLFEDGDYRRIELPSVEDVNFLMEFADGHYCNFCGCERDIPYISWTSCQPVTPRADSALLILKIRADENGVMATLFEEPVEPDYYLEMNYE